MLAGSPLSQEDAWQRAVEFLFERLAVRWEIAGAVPIERQKELLARFRFASPDERAWIRDVLREHLAEHFPELRGAVTPRPERQAVSARRGGPATSVLAAAPTKPASSTRQSRPDSSHRTRGSRAGRPCARARSRGPCRPW